MSIRNTQIRCNYMRETQHAGAQKKCNDANTYIMSKTKKKQNTNKQNHRNASRKRGTPPTDEHTHHTRTPHTYTHADRRN